VSLDVVAAIDAWTDTAVRAGAEHVRARHGADEVVLEVDPARSQAADVVPYLRLLAPMPALDDFELDVSPRRRRFPALQDAFGDYRLVVDDAVVSADQVRTGLGDSDLHLRTNDRALAAALLDPPARGAVFAALRLDLQRRALRGVRGVVRGPRIRIDRDRLEVELEGGVALDHLPHLVRAAAAVATAPARIARAWAAAADALGGRAPGAWDVRAAALTVDRGGVPVTFATPRVADDGALGDAPRALRTRAVARLPTDAPPWRLVRRGPRRGAGLLGDYHTRADRLAHVRHVLGPVSGHLAAAQPDAIVAGAREVHLQWDGLLTDPARLGPALDVLRAIVAGDATDAGPYR
jgi:hypothetical protein